MSIRGRPLLVVVTGAPAAGKTTVARPLARALGLPLIAKDDIKETLFDHLGTGDRAWSRKLGGATFELQLRLAAELLEAGVSVVIEGNFDGRFELLSRLPPHRAVQVHCHAHADTLMQRYASRPRHPGHHDAAVLEELRRGEHDDRIYRLDVEPTIELETTSPVDVERLAERVAALAHAG